MPSDEESPQPSRLLMVPNFDFIHWTHLQNTLGNTVILQELPRPLRGMISGFIGRLIDCGIQWLEFDPSRSTEVRVRGDGADDRGFRCRNPASVRQGLTLTAWWMELDRRRQFARARKRRGAIGPYALWHCPDCHQDVVAERDFCSNSKCPSWDKLYQCTGDHLLHNGRVAAA